MALDTAWEQGRFDEGAGPRRVLFGRMYEDPSIELSLFEPGGRDFCIASAGDTAMALCTRHDVVAVDLNPVQLTYCEGRLKGAPRVKGTAEKVMSLGRTFFLIAGWWPSTVREFLELDDPTVQAAFWKQHLDTWRFRAGLDALMSVTALKAVYASRFLGFLPRRFGAVMRARMERCFGLHPNKTNPWARALLLGELAQEPIPAEVSRITLAHGDAASFLEAQAPGSFVGFTLSNILDGAEETYRQRLFAAVARAAAPGAKVVLRSFGEPAADVRDNRAADDRSMLWGVVDVRPAEASAWLPPTVAVEAARGAGAEA